jgi:hypothetical protein
MKEIIGLEYGWLWITAAINFLVYIPVYLCLRGNLCGSLSNQGIWLAFRRRNQTAYKCGFERREGVTEFLWMVPYEGHGQISPQMMQKAKVMLWYPAG